MKYPIVTFLILLLVASSITAQPYSRPDDHFWRKKVVQRIDLREKINQPLVAHESSYYNSSRYSETDGIVMSLINGMKEGKYKAYHPEDWDQTYDYAEISARMQEFDRAWEGEGEGLPAIMEDGAEWDDAWNLNEFGVESDNDLLNESGTVQDSWQADYSAYEDFIHIVEDWVFDKTRSEMMYQPQFFQVIWTDPSGILPDKVLANFLWEDVKDALDKTQWKNRFNDAEYRSVREVFELRLFNGFIINLSGVGVKSLAEAEKRRQELVEFEHHLWSY